MKTVLGLFCLIGLLTNSVQGQEFEKKIDKITESKSIKNLDEALQEAEGDLGFRVIFPTSIPDGRQLYAYFERSAGTGWPIISLSPDETCHGAKFCSIGSISLRPYGRTEIRKDMSGKPITEMVKLRDNIDGYYTPGHPMGDYWPPSLQWFYNDTLYDLSWSVGDRADLIDMANSAILGASHKETSH